MPVASVPGSDAITVVDTVMFGVEGYTAAFLVQDHGGDGDETVLIDTGLSTSVDALRRGIAEAGGDIADVDTVVVTHVHLDHAGALADVVDASDARVVCHPRAEPYLVDPDAAERLVANTKRAMGPLGDAYGTMEPVDPDRVSTVDDGDAIPCGDLELRVLHATGHAPHHLALFEPGADALFVVDEGCAYFDGQELPTTPPPNFDYDVTLESFERFRRLDPEVLLYGHYGANPDGADAIDRHEAALRDWVTAVEEAAADHDEASAVVETVVSSYATGIDDPIAEEILRRDVRGVLGYLAER